MDEFEKTISTILGDNGKFNAEKAETLRREMVQMFEKKLKIALIIAWVGIGIAVVFEAGGWIGLALSILLHSNVKFTILFGVIALSGGQFHLLSKLWYWVYHNEIKMRKEVKQLQLQVVELTGKEPPAEI